MQSRFGRIQGPVKGKSYAKAVWERLGHRQIERAALPAHREGHVAPAVHLQIDARSQRPPIAEVGDIVGIEAVVAALDANRESGRRHYQVRNGRGYTSRLVVAAHRDHDGAVHRLTCGIGGLEPHKVVAIAQQRCVDRANRAAAARLWGDHCHGVEVRCRIVRQRPALQCDSRDHRDRH